MSVILVEFGPGRRQEDAEKLLEGSFGVGERGESGVIESGLCRRGWHLSCPVPPVLAGLFGLHRSQALDILENSKQYYFYYIRGKKCAG
jgi:hypothetical protein